METVSAEQNHLAVLNHTPVDHLSDPLNKGEYPIEEIVANIAPSDEDAITRCLELLEEVKSHPSNQQLGSLILDRALAITRESDRETRFEERTSFFGLYITSIPRASVFEVRRSLLEKQLSEELIEHLKYRQPFVTGVVSLFNPDDQAILWQNYSQQLAGRGFVNGRYERDAIQHVRTGVLMFADIAPPPVGDETKRIIRARLIASGAL